MSTNSTELFKYSCIKPARLIFSNVTAMSAPHNIPDAKPRFSGTFGVEEEDFKGIVAQMVSAIKAVTGSFSGNPADYYLPCLSGKQMGQRAIQKAELDARGKSADEAFKLKEKAEKRAATYAPYAGILSASSQFDIVLGRVNEEGLIKDITEEKFNRAQRANLPLFPNAPFGAGVTWKAVHERAGKELFYPGAFVAAAISIKGTLRKKVDDKDGCTAFLNNVLFVRHGEKPTGGGGASNDTVFGGTWSGYSNVDPTALAPTGNEAAPAPEAATTEW